MLEAKLIQGVVLKKLMDAIKDLVEEANFDCSSTGIALQAMDSSHVSLVTLFLKADGFEHFRADRNMSLGIKVKSMCQILKCAGSEDMITLKADEQGDTVTFMFESPKQNRISHFQLKLMDIDQDTLGIPDQDYECVVRMPASEFQRICREIMVIGDTVKITASKNGVRFGVDGDLGTGSIILKQSTAIDEDEKEGVTLKVDKELSLTFALRYLNSFAKATTLCDYVTLKMSEDVPLLIEYKIGEEGELGALRFFLAPKIEEEGEEDEAEDDDDEGMEKTNDSDEE